MLFQSTLRIPWLSFAKSLPLYALAVAHFTCNWGYYTLLTSLPQYFKHILHFDIKSVSVAKLIARTVSSSFAVRTFEQTRIKPNREMV